MCRGHVSSSMCRGGGRGRGGIRKETQLLQNVAITHDADYTGDVRGGEREELGQARERDVRRGPLCLSLRGGTRDLSVFLLSESLVSRHAFIHVYRPTLAHRRIKSRRVHTTRPTHANACNIIPLDALASKYASLTSSCPYGIRHTHTSYVCIAHSPPACT